MTYLDTHAENCALIAHAVLEGALDLSAACVDRPPCTECGRTPKHWGARGLCSACWSRSQHAKHCRRRIEEANHA